MPVARTSSIVKFLQMDGHSRTVENYCPLCSLVRQQTWGASTHYQKERGRIMNASPQ